MPIALEIAIIVFLILITIGVFPLLIQLRRTAKHMDNFLISSKQDLTQIAEDVHAARMRLENLAGSLQICLDGVTRCIQSVEETGQTIKHFRDRVQIAVESAAQKWKGILGGISTVLAFFKCHQTSAHKE